MKFSLSCSDLLPIVLLPCALGDYLITSDSMFYGQSPPYYPTPPTSGLGAWNNAYIKAKQLVELMTLEEKVNLTTGYRSVTNGCSGNILGIPRLGFPGLCLTDSGNNIAGTDLVSTWPSGIHMGASWNKELVGQKASSIAKQARRKGINVVLGPVVSPLGRLPVGGRGWEGYSVDPYLSGSFAAEVVKVTQGEGVVSCVKHFIGNEQETHRSNAGNVTAVSSNIDDITLHETYLRPFQDALRAGSATVMCGYNRVNNSYACQNSNLLNKLLKTELHFQGAVISDWGALHAGYDAALAGLDMVMPDSGGFFGANLTISVTNGSLPESRVNDMATRIISSWYLTGQDRNYTELGIGMPPNIALKHERVEGRDPQDTSRLFEAAVQGHVLVKNINGALPLKNPRTLFLSGYSATSPTQNVPPLNSDVSGYQWLLGFQSSVAGLEAYSVGLSGGRFVSPSIAINGTIITGGGSGTAAVSTFMAPFDSLLARATKDMTQLFWDFSSPTPSPLQDTDACLVFGNAFASEAYDRPSLRDDYTDGIIMHVASLCNNTIVILHNAGPRLVDQWIDHPNITAVIFAHLPGESSGEALVSLLYGDSQFSGKLPYSVARNESDYGGLLYPSQPEGQYELFPQSNFTEGIYIDYLHFERYNITPRFEFGFGLSYTTYNYSNLTIENLSRANTTLYPQGPLLQGGPDDLWCVLARVTFQVTNTGSTPGAEVAQLYTKPVDGLAKQLRGYAKPLIEAGQSAQVTLDLTRRDLSFWDVTTQAWKLHAGDWEIFVGPSSSKILLQSTMEVLTSE